MTVNTDLNNSIPNIINISFKDIDGESLLILLGCDNIYVSAGSACNSGDIKSSHVLEAINTPKDYIHGTIRISFSDETTNEELTTAAESIKKSIKKIRGYL